MKLENVMVTDQQDWHVTIVDFGLSVAQSLDGSRTVKAAGTTSTAAPEVIREGTSWSDVWSMAPWVSLGERRDPFLRDDRRDDPAQKIRSGRLRLGAHRDHVAAGKAFVFKCLRPHRAYDGRPTRRCDTVRARRPFNTPTPSTLRPAGLAEWRPAALRPVNIDTNVPETTEKRDKSPRLAPELESSLKRYGSYTELKRAALIIAAAQTDKRSVKKREVSRIDTDAWYCTKRCFVPRWAGRLAPDRRSCGSTTIGRRGPLRVSRRWRPQLLNEVLQDTFDRMDHDDSGVYRGRT